MTLDNTTLTSEGQSVTLTAIVLPDKRDEQVAQLDKQHPAVATVNQSGEVDALTTGTTIVKATAKDGSGNTMSVP